MPTQLLGWSPKIGDFEALGISTLLGAAFSSLSFAWVCMVNSTELFANGSRGYDGDLPWGKAEQKFIFSAYNAGGLLACVLPGLPFQSSSLILL